MSEQDKPGGMLRPKPEQPSAEAWLNTEETATCLGLHPKTLANMRSLGTGPSFHKIGSKVWYRGNDIIAYQNRRRYVASGVRDET